MDPTFAVAHNCVGYAFLQMGRAPEAVAEFQTAVRLSGGDTESVSALGYAFGASGKGKEAVEILSQLQSPSEDAYLPAYYIAIVDSGLGRKDETFAWLERAYRSRTSELPEVKTEPMFIKLRDDPRFHELLQRIGLPL